MSIPVDKRAYPIHLQSNSPFELFLIHGYTGSPADFDEMPYYLHNRFGVEVKVLLLKGHGTTVADLRYIKCQDFFEQIETEFKKDLMRGKKIILGGISFGTYPAIYLASKYSAIGIIAVTLPYHLRFPFNIPGLFLLGLFKKQWNKKFYSYELELRKNKFTYTKMHSNGLRLIKYSKKKIRNQLSTIKCPCLLIHSKNDPIAHYNSIKIINKNIRSSLKKIVVYDNEIHNLFFSQYREQASRVIENFLDQVLSQQKESNPKIDTIAAIICAYNEEKRIGAVLEVLTSSSLFTEIIVVDDGSTDNTKEVVHQFKNIIYLRNDKNHGKGYSMERGVNNTTADILFFCDADLVGFTKESIKEIIHPVMENKVDMFIGIRNNIMQKSFLPFAINSGERAMRRTIWNSIPWYYKHRYRIEVGLNSFVKSSGKRFAYKVLPYYQTLKEKKYGLMQGTLLRWWMNIDVSLAYLRAKTIDRNKFKKHA